MLAKPMPMPLVPAAIQRGHASLRHTGHASHCVGELEGGCGLALPKTPTQAPCPQCNLQGLWRNELGSNMTLSALDAVGTFSGSYHTAVAATDKQILVSPLQGSQQHTSAKGHPTFGFTVQWQFAGTAIPGAGSRPQPTLGVGCPWPIPHTLCGTQRSPGCSHRPAAHTRPCRGMWWGRTGWVSVPLGQVGVRLSVCPRDMAGAMPICLSR